MDFRSLLVEHDHGMLPLLDTYAALLEKFAS